MFEEDDEGEGFVKVCESLPGIVVRYDGSSNFVGRKFQQRVLLKVKKEFVWVKLPEFSIEERFELKEPDYYEAREFVATGNSSPGWGATKNNILVVTSSC